jgi:hypothetical protein
LEEWVSVSEEESVKEAREWELVGESEKAVAALEMARALAMAVLAVAATDLREVQFYRNRTPLDKGMP